MMDGCRRRYSLVQKELASVLEDGGLLGKGGPGNDGPPGVSERRASQAERRASYYAERRTSKRGSMFKNNKSNKNDENGFSLRLPSIKSSPSQRSSMNLQTDSTNDASALDMEDSITKMRKKSDEFNPDKIAAELQYARLQGIFEKADLDGECGLSIDEFQHAIKKTVGGNLNKKNIKTLFMKLDANCDGVVDWEEYVTYNLLEYQEKTQMIEMMRDKPFPPETQDIPSRHRDMIVRVAFFPSIQKRGPGRDRIDYSSGRYVSLSKEGVVVFWNLKMKKTKSCLCYSHTDRATNPWFTDMTCMYNVNMLAITSTDRDITVFDLQGNKFQKRYYLTGIENCITAMSYWSDMSDLNIAVMLWGDTSGNVFVLKFDQALRGGPFGPLSGKDPFKRVSLPEVIRGFYIGIKGYRLGKIHDDWVSQISYVPILNCMMSCCQHSDSSLYISDMEKKKITNMFKVNKGILSFDYCPINNIIVTGGMDYLVRVWNPYVNSKAIVILKGHSKPVTHVVINSSKNQIISIDKGRNIRVFDMKDQTCIQQLTGRVIKLGPFSISAICFNPITQTLVLATNQLAMLEKHFEEENRMEFISHMKPVLFALYNKLFNMVVSVCQDSVVSVWDIDTGEKIIQFINAHKRIERGVEIPVEISAITFDGPCRRLLTGARDGSVKVWNFNNGACLQTFNLPGGRDVTGIVCTRNRIYVTGWDRLVHVYVDGEEEDFRKQWKQKHKEDILCMGCLSSNGNILATGSYDGDIIIWSRETGQDYCKLNAFKGTLPITENTKNVDAFESSNDRRSSTLENGTPSDEMISDRTKQRKSVKSIRQGVGILQKVREIATEGENKSQQSSRAETPCEHPLLAAFDRQQEPAVDDGTASGSRQTYDDICKVYEASVENIIFLEHRDNLEKNTAVLVASGSEGWVRFWSINLQGGLLGQFNASHTVGEGVHALATDEENNFLVTADTGGYLKIWDITEYCTKDKHSPLERITRWEYLKDTFPFIKFEYGVRAGPPRSFTSKMSRPENIWKRPPPASSCPKRTARWPLLVNSFRAHNKVINSVAVVDGFDMICTCSVDCSIRVWTFGGQYIGTFGSKWNPLSPRRHIATKRSKVPRDLRRTGSAKSLKVLHSGDTPLWQTAFEIIKKRGITRPITPTQKVDVKAAEAQNTDDIVDETEKKLERSEILGKSYKRKVRHKLPPTLPKFIETANSVSIQKVITI